ncbi:proton-coupled folate transporter [Plutella xylostella]|uniref:proton-coupled folate transporter n=1 Tax=Plutella xylostella TaxID=51655 RepID=UPI002032A3F6|nr:proton-coupled folate transporter [Plutella xylostella]
MSALAEPIWGSDDLTKSNIRLTDTESRSRSIRENCKSILKKLKYFYVETTVEPCLFVYMLCIALSTLAVQNMHLEKACRVNFKFGDDICDRIRDRNTTGLEDELNKIESLVAKVTAWKFPLQTGIPAVMVLFVGAWSDKTKKRKICILFPMVGEIVTNIGLLLATYYFDELSVSGTVLIEALPPALTGSYIIVFMGMYSFMADRTSVENRTFRLGIVTIFVNLGTPLGTALSGIVLRAIGYYGIFTLVLCLHIISFLYGILKLEDSVCEEDNDTCGSSDGSMNRLVEKIKEVLGLVINTVAVVFKKRDGRGRTLIILVLALYLLMVGPLYGDSQVAYLYAIRRFSFDEVEYSIYGATNSVLGIVGTLFCVSLLSKKLRVEDSAIGGLAGVSRIASCFVIAFAPNRDWFYSAPVFNIFSSTGLAAVRSIATKAVPTKEIAKLSALMGVSEALAPSIYSPASNHIYVKTIDYFPGAFYMFDAVLTGLALVLFLIVYIIMRRRNIADHENEQVPKSNEVSRF